MFTYDGFYVRKIFLFDKSRNKTKNKIQKLIIVTILQRL